VRRPGRVGFVGAVSVLDDCEVFDVASDAVGDTFGVFVGHCHASRTPWSAGQAYLASPNPQSAAMWSRHRWS
jgi:hypothetical protein